MVDASEKIAISPVLRGLIRGATARGGKLTSRGADKVPSGFAKALSGVKAPDRAWRGYRQMGTGSTDSLLAFLPMMAAEKLIGKDRVRGALWKHVNAPALRADTAVGHTLGKVPGMKKLFTTTDKVPWGKDLHKDIKRPSALAPLSKIRDIGAPIIVGVGLEKGLGKATEIARGSKDSHPMNQELRDKVASTMLGLHAQNKEHTKRAQALRLLYKQAELGIEQIPQTFDELETKLASLITQDLAVVEKALELTAGQFKLGELDDNRDLNTFNASEQFQAQILSDF